MLPSNRPHYFFQQFDFGRQSGMFDERVEPTVVDNDGVRDSQTAPPDKCERCGLRSHAANIIKIDFVQVQHFDGVTPFSSCQKGSGVVFGRELTSIRRFNFRKRLPTIFAAGVSGISRARLTNPRA